MLYNVLKRNDTSKQKRVNPQKKMFRNMGVLELF